MDCISKLKMSIQSLLLSDLILHAGILNECEIVCIIYHWKTEKAREVLPRFGFLQMDKKFRLKIKLQLLRMLDRLPNLNLNPENSEFPNFS